MYTFLLIYRIGVLKTIVCNKLCNQKALRNFLENKN